MHINEQLIIATSYLAQEGDEKNKCLLSIQTLFIRYKNKVERFSLDEISILSFKKKMFLMPLIAGGIIAPFFLLALFNAIGNVWVDLTCMTGGLLLIYYGYEGSMTLCVETRIKEFDFFIKSPTPNLRAFAQYAMQLIKHGERGSLFYLHLTNEQVQTLHKEGYLVFNEETRLLYLDDVILSRTPYFAVNPMDIPDNFSLKLVNGHMIPTLSGKIRGEYIIKGT